MVAQSTSQGRLADWEVEALWQPAICLCASDHIEPLSLLAIYPSASTFALRRLRRQRLNKTHAG